MQLMRLRVPGRRPVETFEKLRRKHTRATEEPELYALAGQILDQQRLEQLSHGATAKTVRQAIRAKTAEDAVAYMTDLEDRPLTDL